MSHLLVFDGQAAVITSKARLDTQGKKCCCQDPKDCDTPCCGGGGGLCCHIAGPSGDKIVGYYAKIERAVFRRWRCDSHSCDRSCCVPDHASVNFDNTDSAYCYEGYELTQRADASIDDTFCVWSIPVTVRYAYYRCGDLREFHEYNDTIQINLPLVNRDCTAPYNKAEWDACPSWSGAPYQNCDTSGFCNGDCPPETTCQNCLSAYEIGDCEGASAQFLMDKNHPCQRDVPPCGGEGGFAADLHARRGYMTFQVDRSASKHCDPDCEDCIVS